MTWFLHISELVDSLCRDGTDTTHPFSHIEWLRTPKHGSYKPFQTHTHTMSVSVPAKTLKYRATMINLARPHFCSSSSSSNSVLVYCKSGTTTLLGLSLACVILDQLNLCNFTRTRSITSLLLEAIFSLCMCILHFIGRWAQAYRIWSRRGLALV